MQVIHPSTSRKHGRLYLHTVDRICSGGETILVSSSSIYRRARRGISTSGPHSNPSPNFVYPRVSVSPVQACYVQSVENTNFCLKLISRHRRVKLGRLNDAPAKSHPPHHSTSRTPSCFPSSRTRLHASYNRALVSREEHIGGMALTVEIPYGCGYGGTVFVDPGWCNFAGCRVELPLVTESKS